MERQQGPKPDPPAPTRDRGASEPRFALDTSVGPPMHRDERGPGSDEVAQLVHDLRDPLSTIALETYALDRKLAGGDHVEVRSTTARILHNVDFLVRIVQNLLDSCAIGAGHFEIHRRPTELRALLEQILDRVVSTRDLGRVTLDAPRPITLSIDDLAIERVVANLVGNALKYAPKHSRIVVQLAAGVLDARISVTDAGPGLTPSEREYVFDKYRRGASARGREGRGLGLYVSKVIVEAHGGRIGVDDVEGAGSRFFFELPARSP